MTQYPKLFVYNKAKPNIILKYASFEFRIYNDLCECVTDIESDVYFVSMKSDCSNSDIDFKKDYIRRMFIFSPLIECKTYFNSVTSLVNKLTEAFFYDSKSDTHLNDFLLIACIMCF